MRKMLFILAGGLALLLSVPGCETEGDREDVNTQSDPIDELIASGDLNGELRPFDLVENPGYTPLHKVDFLQDEEPVFLSKACGLLLVYPHRSMYVEIVNEAYNGVWMAVSYCPITRSGICFNRVHGEDTLLLTASGYLFRENMVPMDLHSGSLWSQMQLRGMAGKHHDEMFETIPLIETAWKTVRDYFPSAAVFIVDSLRKSGRVDEDWTGQSLIYRQEFGILGRNEVELFTPELFPGEITLHFTTVRPGGKVVVAGSSTHQYMVAFLSTYQMQAVEGQFPVIMKDETGTLWNLFGEAVSGERGGEKLQSPVAYAAADWAWSNLFERVSYFTPQGSP